MKAKGDNLWTTADLLHQASAAICGEALSPPDGRSQSVPTGPLRGTIEEADEFLANHEYELAWDALAEVAEAQRSTPPIWLLLAQAAGLMALDGRVSRALDLLGKSLSTKPVAYRIVYQVGRRDAAGRLRWRGPKMHLNAVRPAEPHLLSGRPVIGATESPAPAPPPRPRSRASRA
jgi:hypothetical protein